MNFKPPMFVFNERTYTNNLRALQNAFKKRMVGIKIGYSFKTNPHPFVLKAALDNECYAEVVSPFEYQKAVAIGFPLDMIIYNGVCKDIEQAYECASSGGIVNIDSLDELMLFSKYVTHDVNIGVRLSFDIGNGIVSRFGIPIDSKDFEHLLEFDKQSEHIHITGLSCHITHARTYDEWKIRARTMADVARKFKEIKFIDLGGNMYSPMDARFALNFPDYVSFSDYADAICPELEGLGVDLILETGTPLIANAVDLWCEVIGIKKNKDKTFVVVNASSYDIGIVCRNTSLTYDVEYSQSLRNGWYTEIGSNTNASVVGYTCIEDDVICEKFNAPVSVGDNIIFHNVGAYSLSFASDFIMPMIDLVSRR